MNYRYAVIQGDEDGNPISYLSPSEEEDINALMENHGITEWIEDYGDPMYWEPGNAMLVKVQCINPRPVKEVTTWKLPE